MKTVIKLSGLMLLLITYSQKINACDVCGCAASGGYTGILPQYKAKMLGLQWNTQLFAHPGNIGKDVFNYAEFNYRNLIHPRLLLSFNIPYTWKSRTENSIVQHTAGLGDIRVYGHFFLINNSDSMSNRLKHTLQLISGVKMPTGKYQQRASDLTMFPAGMQAGNGAWAVPTMIQYTLRKKQLGLNMDAQYWINSTNELNYKTGNLSAFSASVFYWKKYNQFNWIIRLGGVAQFFESDYELKREVEHTGGKYLKGDASLDLITPRYSIFLKSQKPFWNKISTGQPNERIQFWAGINLFLNRN